MNKLFSLLLCLLAVQSFCQKSQLRIFKKTFKTYMYSDPDPVPHPQSNIYPYYRFDGYTDEPVDKEWTIVALENQWIKLHITPEIGGKIWGAWEKSTGFPFIYANDVVKFRDVAMRGAWTSGGIEFNFGDIGHAPTVATPVDWMTRENPDGSVSCFVGAPDLSSHTRWMVEINLPPDKAYFTTRSRWYNNTPFETSYYHWMNGGFRAAGNLEFCFPGTNYIGHEGELHPWPIDEKGRDLRWYKNNDFGSYKSYHVLGEPTDWFGAYWHDDSIGVVHYSPYADKLGKKIWVWGLSRQGYIWEDLLTDNSGQYVELQSGRLFNQAAPGSINSPFKHVAFKPYTTDEWTEYWYPVKGTGGIDYGNDRGAFKFIREKDSLLIRFSPLKYIRDTMTFEYIDRKNFRRGSIKKAVELEPLQLLEQRIELPENEPFNIKQYWVYVGDELVFDMIANTDTGHDRSGNTIYKSPSAFNWDSEYGQYLYGKDLMNQRKYGESLQVFLKILKSNPYHVPALGDVAEITYKKGEYGRAIEYAVNALKVDTYDPKSNFIYALIENASTNNAAEIKHLAVAAQNMSYRSAAYYRMALSYFKFSNYRLAAHYLNESLTANPNNNEAATLYLILLRKTKKIEEAKLYVKALLEEDPLNHIVRFEKYLLTNDSADVKAFIEPIRNEFSHVVFEGIYSFYSGILAGDEERLLIKLASKIQTYAESMNYTKPTGFFTRQKKEWESDYFSGLEYWHNNDTASAARHFNTCASTPDYYPFYLAKADLFHDDPKVVLEALGRAWQLDSTAWRTAVRLANFHLQNGNPAHALRYAQAGIAAHPKHSPMGVVYAKTLNVNGLYEKCAAFLKKFKVLPAEGAYEAHEVWREAHLHVALDKMAVKNWGAAITSLDAAMDWPENLGSGKPYFPDERLPMLLKAHCFKKAHRQGEAAAAKSYLLSYKNPDEPVGFIGEFIAALALAEKGETTEALRRIGQAAPADMDAALLAWCKDKAQGIEGAPPASATGRDWKVLLRFFSL